MIAREVFLQTAVIVFMYLKLIFTSPFISGLSQLEKGILHDSNQILKQF